MEIVALLRDTEYDIKGVCPGTMQVIIKALRLAGLPGSDIADTLDRLRRAAIDEAVTNENDPDGVTAGPTLKWRDACGVNLKSN